MQYLGMSPVQLRLDVAIECRQAAEELIDRGYESERLDMAVTQSEGILLSKRSTKIARIRALASCRQSNMEVCEKHNTFTDLHIHHHFCHIYIYILYIIIYMHIII